MKLVMLGTGTLVPSAQRASAGLAVVHEDTTYPFDLGRGVLGRMVQAGLAPLELDHLHLTHLHPDHTCDLVPLLFAMNYATDPPRTRPLSITAPVGLTAWWEHLRAAWRWLTPPYPLQLREMGAGEFVEGPARIATVPLEHGSTANLGYRLQIGGKAVAYTGDTGPTPALLSLARHVDILVAECSLPDDLASATHLSPTWLGRLAKDAGCSRLVVTHLYPQNDPVEVERGVRRHFGGDVILAEDLQEIEV